MSRNLYWKIGLIVLLVIFMGLMVYPPQERLKPGLDLAGGTSLIYEIDTEGLERSETRNLAQNMIPILRKRIDPSNVANIVMRPQGDTRIEIQLPVASKEAQQKRQKYEDALLSLASENLNLMIVKRALSYDKKKRSEVFEQFAQSSEERLTILENLADIYDRREQAFQKRNQYQEKIDGILEKVDSIGLDPEQLRTNVSDWAKLTDQELKKEVKKFLENNKPDDKDLLQSLMDLGQPAAESLIIDYVNTFEKWASIVDEISQPETGLMALYNEAVSKLAQLNLSVEGITDILQLPMDSQTRQERIESIKQQYPNRVEKIEKVVSAYAEYKEVGGRLDDPEDLKRLLKGSGVLEFRILPSPQDGTISASQVEALREALQLRGPKLASTINYKWFEIEDPENWNAGGIVGMFGDKLYVLASNKSEESMLQEGTDKWKLRKAMPTTDYRSGRPAVSFTLDETAARIFYNLTRKNVGRPLCIMLDDIAISAPNINEPIRGQGQISGDFTQTEVQNMVYKLNAGSFPARLSEVPISEKSIGPAIGTDNRDQGIRAGLIGLFAVALFMIAYYLLPGFIADIALIMNIIFIMGMMAMFQATFTLPGIAGIILTIGMSVDANVLIFERIREEQIKGSSLRTAIANGYNKAFRTIFDANVTTFITALILYMVASEEIKGFAIVLMLGIASSMFTALFVTRVILQLLLDLKIIRDHLVMLRIIKKPNFNWMGARPIFFTVSIVLVIAGLTVFFTRDEEKNSKYDIEFTGGTSVQINLRESVNFSRADVENEFQKQAQKMNNKALMAAKVYSVGESGHTYEISTTETNKTTANVKFNSGTEHTPESVNKEIMQAADQLGKTIYNLEVQQQGPTEYIISTSQVNKNLVREVLNTAFEDAQVSEPQVDQVVTEAVRNAFEGLLSIRQNLQPNILTVERVTESDVELADFLGGVAISVELDQKAYGQEIKERFRDIRFKPDSRDLQWYTYKIINPDYTELQDDQQINSFVYVSVHPEAGYRELSDDEISRYIENEKEKITKAATLETTLARVTQIDPSIGQQAKTRALIAIILSLIAIVGYIWIRFGTARYGFAAIAALVHDVCITLGAVTVTAYIAGTGIGNALGIGDFKISLEMIAAFLTIIGYSLNDTIVVFDRIRENKGKLKDLTAKMVTESINQTLSRTLLTSFTTFLAVLIMYIWGGTGLRGFTFALLIGIIVGTYSSIAISSPILLLGKKTKNS